MIGVPGESVHRSSSILYHPILFYTILHAPLSTPVYSEIRNPAQEQNVLSFTSSIRAYLGGKNYILASRFPPTVVRDYQNAIKSAGRADSH